MGFISERRGTKASWVFAGMDEVARIPMPEFGMLVGRIEGWTVMLWIARLLRKGVCVSIVADAFSRASGGVGRVGGVTRGE